MVQQYLIVELHRLALEANLLPSIFDTKAQDMWLGRKQRTASEAQRVALIARDQHCIGCSANPLWCRAHHIIWWSKNGPTDVDNLVLVCDDCHHKIHDHDWQVYKHPNTGKYQLKPPNPTGTPKPSTVTGTPAVRNASGDDSVTGTIQTEQRDPDGANPDRSRQTHTGPSNADRAAPDRVTGTDLDRIERRRSSDLDWATRTRPGPT